MATSAAQARQQARARATTITAIVARHQQIDVKDVSNWTPLGPEAIFIVADVEECLDRYLTQEVKHKLYSGDVVALIAAFEDPA